MKRPVRSVTLALSLFLLLWPSFSSPARAQTSSSSPAVASYFAPERVLAFADHLRGQGDFQRAISEYQRYLFIGEMEERPHVLYQIGLSFYELGEPFQASEHFLEASHLAAGADLRDSARIGYAASLLRSEMYAPFFDVAAPMRLETPSLQLRLTEMTALAHVRRGEWRDAQLVLETMSHGQAPSRPGAPVSPIGDLVERGRNLPRKSPVLAAAMSALVPGTGKIYADRLEDGLNSLILIGGASWLAYEGFRDRGTSSVKGWLFGTVGVALYVGNVYGSTVAVRIHNAGHVEALQRDIQAQISISTRL